MNDTPELAPQEPKKKRFVMTKKKLLIIVGVVAVIVLLVAGVILIRQATMPVVANAPNPINTAQANFKYKVAISITDAGFEPATVTVDKSTQLNFQNNGTAPHSIVADTETLKTEPTLGFKNGDATPVTLPSGNYSSYYNYTFQNSGTYHLHDGYNPTANLTIVVK